MMSLLLLAGPNASARLVTNSMRRDAPTKAQVPSAYSQRVPLSHLYWHFLLHQNHLDKEAAAREKQEKDGKWLRSYHKQRLGFNDAQFGLVREAATKMEADLRKIDDEAQSIITADRASHPRVLLNPNDLPPIPPRLLQLRDERETAIQRAADNLRANLGNENGAKLDKYLETEFAPNVRIQYVGPPRPHIPIKNTGPLSPSEVQR